MVCSLCPWNTTTENQRRLRHRVPTVLIGIILSPADRASNFHMAAKLVRLPDYAYSVLVAYQQHLRTLHFLYAQQVRVV
jgi:hypothetical protein